MRVLEFRFSPRLILLWALMFVFMLGSIESLLAQKSLPKILVIGDTVYTQPAAQAQSMLKGRVEVVWATIQPGEVRNSHYLLKDLDRLLGNESWDLIHFNVGLGDLVYRVPGMKSFRVMSKEAGGVRATSPEDYEKNLVGIVKKLKKTKAKLVWASTTPIRHSATKVFQVGSEIEYNKIAEKVMTSHKIAINDMYSHVKNLIDMNRPASHGADPFHFDRKPLHPPIVKTILKELHLLRPVKGPVKVFIMVGGWSHIGGGIVVGTDKPRAGANRGTLDDFVLNEKTKASYSHLLEKDGSWATRPDVWIQFDRRGPKSGALGIGFGGDRKRGIGTELALGHQLGNHFEEQVLVLKTTLGDPSLSQGLQPPSSGTTGKFYISLIKQIRDSLKSLQDKFPDYSDKSQYEISGLILQLGENEKDVELFEKNLALLIQDLRKDLKVPKSPVVIVGSGRGGYDETEFPEIIKAQQRVSQLPQFSKSVIYIDTRNYWPQKDARNAWRHSEHRLWYNNAESFYRMGEAIGQGMLKYFKE